MNKNKSSKCQERCIQKKNQCPLETPNKKEKLNNIQLTKPQNGIVISRFGMHADIEATDGTQHRCSIRRKLKSLVTGDRVVWCSFGREHQGVNGIIEGVSRRSSLLIRPDFYSGTKPIAANINQMIIVLSILPAISTKIIDRYLVVSERLRINPLIVLNKIDLLTPGKRIQIDGILETYRRIGYRVLEVSSMTLEGMAPLTKALSGYISILAGQSGVGKSSLINAMLTPNKKIRVKPINNASGCGQHTTTAVRLYHLPKFVDVIDTPGICEFSLWHLKPEEIVHGFVEFRYYLYNCKFRDCSHDIDPGCAIRAAMEKGNITEKRFKSYQQILKSTVKLRMHKTAINQKNKHFLENKF